MIQLLAIISLLLPKKHRAAMYVKGHFVGMVEYKEEK